MKECCGKRGRRGHGSCCENHCENWNHHIKGFGRRMTLPRKLILDFMATAKGHLSAEEVYLQLKQKEPTIGIATVYRTLELSTKLGIMHKFDFGDGRARYEIAKGPSSKGHHHHLVCIKCKRIIDYDDFIDKETELLQITEAALSKKHNFKITDHLIQFYGLCEDC